MLSRVADALFWMSRYLERAEHVARLLDVCFHLELDLHGVLAGPHELQWTSLAAILQQQIPEQTGSGRLAPGRHQPLAHLRPGQPRQHHVVRLAGAGQRPQRPRHHQLRDVARAEQALPAAERPRVSAARPRESPHEYYQAVECGSCLFQGVCDATLNHDEGWQFIQLGKYLERAEKTLRILDIQYHLLHDLNNPADLPLANLLWGAVLRSCRAYEALPAALRRPDRAGARRRVPAAAPAVSALGAL